MSCEKLQDPFSDEEDSEEEEWLKKDGWLQNERDSEMLIAETTSRIGEKELKSNKDLLLEGDQEMEHEESRGNTAQQDEQDSDEEQEGSDSLTDEEMEHSGRNNIAREGDSNEEHKDKEPELRDLSQVEDGETESRDNAIQHAQEEDSEVEQNSGEMSFSTEMEVGEGSGGLQEDSEVEQEVAGVRDPAQKKDGCTKELEGGRLDSSHFEEDLEIGYQARMLEPEKEDEFEGRFH